ncbi:MAG: class I SAM-dependent methyltransferase [Chitinophagales bacterium]|nr:class I SAM-dependent methyltransferase [Chitinophagales bacterium]
MESTQRFSDRVNDYVLYRPSYPIAVINTILENSTTKQNLVVADIGSGTGISAKLFLEENCKVYGVEPNQNMQDAAINYLKEYTQFITINATAIQTTIENHSCDIIVCAQALHWFFNQVFVVEAKRILKPSGLIAIIWNDRDETKPFMQAYEKFIHQFSIDYNQINHKNIKEEDVYQLFKDFEINYYTFSYQQIFDFEGLLGRVTSCSYMPNQHHQNFAEMKNALQNLFNQYQKQGKINFQYQTTLYLCK